MKTKVTMFAALLGLVIPMRAASQVRVGGQLRPRSEFHDASGSDPESRSSVRTRLSIDATLGGSLRLFVQPQDVHVFDATQSALAVGNHVAVHQAFVDAGSLDTGMGVRLGRQELSLGEQRLVGAVDWAQQGRAFDGMRLHAAGRMVRVDAFAFRLGTASMVSGAEDAFLLGVQGTTAAPAGSVDIYGLRNVNAAGALTHQNTMGARYVLQSGIARGRVEGAVQRGERAGMDVAAWMIAAEAGVSVSEKASVTLFFEELSGDDDPEDGTIRVFDTLFATNHKFYGQADLFTSIPAHTGGRGLRDVGARAGWTPVEPVSIGVELHRFLAADRIDGPSRFADEMDVTLGYRFTRRLAILAGANRVEAGPAFASIGRSVGDQTSMYVMLNASF
jgi:Alginate export